MVEHVAGCPFADTDAATCPCRLPEDPLADRVCPGDPAAYSRARNVAAERARCEAAGVYFDDEIPSHVEDDEPATSDEPACEFCGNPECNDVDGCSAIRRYNSGPERSRP